MKSVTKRNRGTHQDVHPPSVVKACVAHELNGVPAQTTRNSAQYSDASYGCVDWYQYDVGKSPQRQRN